jgi:hypothetical protein
VNTQIANQDEVNCTVRPVTAEQLNEAVAIIGRDGISDEEIEVKVASLVKDPMVARRLIDWLPEAFGMVLVSHMGKVTLPKTFRAKTDQGKWIEIELTVEPIFHDAIRLAMDMYHSGPRNTFSNVATRSAVVDGVNRALNGGESLDGASFSGPALLGIPAEFYVSQPKSFWRRLFRRTIQGLAVTSQR